MLKFIAHKADGSIVLGIGLIKKNIDLLTTDNPMSITASALHLDSIHVDEILIFYAETETEITNKLVHFGLISENTKIKYQGLIAEHLAAFRHGEDVSRPTELTDRPDPEPMPDLDLMQKLTERKPYGTV